jgi:hypothetical protein
VTEEILGTLAAVILTDQDPKHLWDNLKVERFGKRASWEENRSTLARSMSSNAYMSLAASYSLLETLHQRAGEIPMGKPVSPVENKAIANTVLSLNRGMVFLGGFLHCPPWWRLLSRRKFDKAQRKAIDGLFERDKPYQDFMRRYAGQAQATKSESSATRNKD